MPSTQPLAGADVDDVTAPPEDERVRQGSCHEGAARAPCLDPSELERDCCVRADRGHGTPRHDARQKPVADRARKPTPRRRSVAWRVAIAQVWFTGYLVVAAMV